MLQMVYANLGKRVDLERSEPEFVDFAGLLVVVAPTAKLVVCYL